MTQHEALLDKMGVILRERYGEGVTDFLFPPPVFKFMQAELLEIDLEHGVLRVRFPGLPQYRNPYHTMQGGMIATGVDNTVGPLSVLIAPPNVTRTLELKYSKPVTLDMEEIVVIARLAEMDEKRIFINAEVRSPDGTRLARAKAVHWIVG